MQKIICIRSDRLGEFLLTLYAIQQIKNRFPRASITLLASAANIPLVAGIPCIDRAIPYLPDRHRGYRGALRLANLLRAERADAIVVFNPKKEFHLAALLAGIPVRIGYARKGGKILLNASIQDDKTSTSLHEVEYNARLAQLLTRDAAIPGVYLKTDQPETVVSLGLRNRAEKYIVLHPFTSDPRKELPFGFWEELIKRIATVAQYPVLLIGSPEERTRAAHFDRLPVKNIVGKTTPRHLATVLAYFCSAFIGLDSGPMHLAALLGIPVIGIFTHSSVSRWRPWSPRASVVTIPAGTSDAGPYLDRIIAQLHLETTPR